MFDVFLERHGDRFSLGFVATRAPSLFDQAVIDGEICGHASPRPSVNSFLHIRVCGRKCERALATTDPSLAAARLNPLEILRYE